MLSFLFFIFCFLSPPPAEIWVFFHLLSLQVSIFPTPKTISSTPEHKIKENLQIGSASLSFWETVFAVPVCRNLNLGPALFGDVSLPQRNLPAFLHFKALGSTQNALEERASPTPLTKIQVCHQERRGLSVEMVLVLVIKGTHIAV